MFLALHKDYIAPASFKMEFGEFEVSLAFDTLYPINKTYFNKASVCIYKNDVNVTNDLFDIMEINNVDEEKFLEICNVVSRLSKLSHKDTY